MTRDNQATTGKPYNKRKAVFISLTVVSFVILVSAVVWSQQSIDCSAGSWPDELFCFSPGTPARSNEINGNFLVLSRQGPPAGSILPFAGNTEPEGWLFCNGQYLNIPSYPELYAVIGTRYGSGTDQFRLPDLQSRYMMGASNMAADLSNATIGSNTSSHSHSITADHSHGGGSLGAHVAIGWDGLYWYYKKNDTELTAATNNGDTWSATFSTGAVAPWGWADTASYPRTKVSGTTTNAHSSGTTATAPENRPESYSMKYIIRY